MNNQSLTNGLATLVLLAVLAAPAARSFAQTDTQADEDSFVYLPGVFAVATSSNTTPDPTPDPTNPPSSPNPTNPPSSPNPTNPPSLPFDPNAIRSGQATYYDADGGGNCSFPASPGDLMVAALNTPDYQGSTLCGARIEVTGPKGSVVVRVVDRCPECPQGNVDLSPQAFERIAELRQGRVPITWRLVSPGVSGPIAYHFKNGSSQWWAAIQIRNHRNPIYSVEARRSDGSYQKLERQMYNYFIASSGLGSAPLTLRVTDIYGNQITDSGIVLVAEALVNGGAQFPAAP
jgi:expansin